MQVATLDPLAESLEDDPTEENKTKDQAQMFPIGRN